MLRIVSLVLLLAVVVGFFLLVLTEPYDLVLSGL